ncbi:DUF4225 domain-containing protein [Erwinia aphidicola]|uniref:DUF4225 domain-containing protein n=2 Tax=Erwinia aphidicola TaxID=68334 RepID=UPI0030CEE8DC
MDNYLYKNRFKSLYYANAEKDAIILRRTADHAAFKYLKNPHIRDKFKSEMETFIQSQLKGIINCNNENQCRELLFNLKKEKDYLDDQTFSLMSRQSRLVASVKIVSDSKTLGYIINGVGIITGSSQVLGGIGVFGSSFPEGNIIDMALGGMLILHGSNNLQESIENIKAGKTNQSGWLKKGYINVAKFMGFDNKTGELAYYAFDLTLSGYTLGRLVVRPDAHRLFKFIPSDYVRKYNTMGAPSLLIEGAGDVISIKSMHETEKSK